MRQTMMIKTVLLCLSLAASPVVLAEIGVKPPVTAPPVETTVPPSDAPDNTPNGESPRTPDDTNPIESNTRTEENHYTPETITDTPLTSEEGNDPREKIKNAVVKVHLVKHSYETLNPWNSDSQKGSGSGLLIESGLILTNAHVAADATFLEVQRHGETKRYEAEVVYISHESDLALLRTKDNSAYKNIQPLTLGDLPKMQQQVEVYGFPIGGNTLSVTRGVVSRIEKQNYVHTGENLMAAQVDAAINFGNSGGPVISDGKVVGVAMQSGFLTENIGYMIPTPIIRHVLDDIKDGRVDGYGFHGFLAQSMENPAMRRKYGLDEQHTGILVHKVYKNSPSDGLIEIGDIVTEMDGHKIENNGTVEFRPGEFIDHTHYIDMHQIGENLKVKIIRNGQEKEVFLHLAKPGKEYLLVKPNQYDKPPSYFIFGGFVFMPLNQDLIDAMDSTPARIGALTYESPDEKRNEAVIMTKVLPADINKDYHHDTNLLIEKVDGMPISNFSDFFDKVQAATGDYITLEAADNYQIVIDRKEAIARQPQILKQYGVNNDRSKDLLETAVEKPAVAATPATALPVPPAPPAPPVNLPPPPSVPAPDNTLSIPLPPPGPAPTAVVPAAPPAPAHAGSPAN